MLLLLPPIYRWCNWGWERLHNMSMVTYLGNGGAGIWTQVTLLHITPCATAEARVGKMYLFMCWASKKEEKLIKCVWTCEWRCGSFLKSPGRASDNDRQPGLQELPVGPALQGWEEYKKWLLPSKVLSSGKGNQTVTQETILEKLNAVLCVYSE